jgi:putative ABC transport system permease protein
LIDHATALPGVRSASFAGSAPMDSPLGTIKVERIDSASAVPLTVDQAAVSPGYFRTMGSRMLRGRGFSWRNLTETGTEIVINEALAKELWPHADPVGRSIKLIYPAWSGMPSWSATASVIGVVENMGFSGISETPEPTIFKSMKGVGFVDSFLIVNGSASIHSLEGVVTSQLTAQVPTLHAISAYSVGDRVQTSRWKVEQRAYFALAGALLMALIAYIGLYGALAYYVNTRRRELAVRICLGAMPGALRKLILMRAARCVLLAVFLSAPLWAILAHLSSSEYLGSVSWSTGRAVALALACVAVAVFISLWPAAAATRVAPAEVLKEL